MRQVKSYSNIWHIGKVIYALSDDFHLPFPITLTQIMFFVSSLFVVVVLKNIPPISLINNFLIKYLCIPGFFTWFMSKKTFDGKSPFGFLRSSISYLFRYKVTYAGRKVKLDKVMLNTVIKSTKGDLNCSL